MEYLYYGGGFLLFLLLAVRAQQVVMLLSFRLRRPEAQLVDMDMVPPPLLAALAPAATELRRLGFEFSHCMTATDMNAALASPQYCSVFYHPELACYADLSTHLTPDQHFPWRVNFLSRYEDDVLFMTMNQEASSVISGCPTLIAEDAFALTLAEQLAAHCRAAKRYEAGQHVAERMPQLGPRGFVKALNSSFKHYIEYLREQRWIYVEGDHFRLRLTAAVRMSAKVSAGLKRVKALHTSAKDSSVSAASNVTADGLLTLEVDAYQRHEQILNHSRLKAGFKAALLLATILLFGVVFGVTWSLDTLLILIGVILFHELGHLAAMRLFGYRDLQVLFIPFLGAAALGKHENPRAYQKVIVSLMGPLPGLLLGTIMLFYLGESSSTWAVQTAVILLVVNFLNLLPLMPLDGGQLLNTVLFNHHPRWQFGFFIVSALALLGWALLEGNPLLMILAGIMLIQVPAHYRQMRVSQNLLTDSAGAGESSEHRVFRALALGKTAGWAFAAKYQMAKALRERIAQAAPASWEVAGALLLYGMALVLPFTILVDYAIDQDVAPYSVSTDWDAEVAAAQGLPAQLDAYVEAAYDHRAANDTDLALRYLERGQEAAESAFYGGEEYALLLQAMATLYQDADYDPGPVYVRLIDLRAKLNGETSVELASVHHEYAVYLLDGPAAHLEANRHNLEAIRIHRALEAPAGLYTALLLNSRIEEQLGNLAAAESSLRQSAELDWHDAWQISTQTGLLLADLYVRQERLPEARRQLQLVLEGLESDDYQRPSTLNRAGWVELFAGEIGEARGFFDRAHKLNPVEDDAGGEFAEYLFLTDGSSYNHRLLTAVSYWIAGDGHQARIELAKGTRGEGQQYEQQLRNFQGLLETLVAETQPGIDARAYKSVLAMLDSLQFALAIE